MRAPYSKRASRANSPSEGRLRENLVRRLPQLGLDCTVRRIPPLSCSLQDTLVLTRAPVSSKGERVRLCPVVKGLTSVTPSVDGQTWRHPDNAISDIVLFYLNLIQSFAPHSAHLIVYI